MASSTNPIINAIARGRAEVLDELKFKEEMETEKERRKAQELVFKKTEQELDRQLKQDQRLLDVSKFQIREALRNSLAGGGNTVDMGEFGKIDFQPREPQMLPNAQGSELTPGMKMPQMIAPLQQVASPLGGMETFSGEEILATDRAQNAATAEALNFEQQKAFIKDAPILERALTIEEIRQQGRERTERSRTEGNLEVARIRASTVESPESKHRRSIALEEIKQANKIGLLKKRKELGIGAAGDAPASDIEALADSFYWGIQAPGKDKASRQALALLAVPTKDFPEGRKPSSPAIMKDLKAMVPVVNVLDSIEDFVKKHPEAFPKGNAMIPGGVAKLITQAKLAPTDTHIEYGNLVARLAQAARGISGEGGQIAQKDIERAQAGIPQEGDSMEIALEKIRQVERDLNTTLNSALVAYGPKQKQHYLDSLGFGEVTERNKPKAYTEQDVIEVMNGGFSRKEAVELLDEAAAEGQ